MSYTFPKAGIPGSMVGMPGQYDPWQVMLQKLQTLNQIYQQGAGSLVNYPPGGGGGFQYEQPAYGNPAWGTGNAPGMQFYNPQLVQALIQAAGGYGGGGQGNQGQKPLPGLDGGAPWNPPAGGGPVDPGYANVPTYPGGAGNQGQKPGYPLPVGLPPVQLPYNPGAWDDWKAAHPPTQWTGLDSLGYGSPQIQGSELSPDVGMFPQSTRPAVMQGSNVSNPGQVLQNYARDAAQQRTVRQRPQGTRSFSQFLGGRF